METPQYPQVSSNPFVQLFYEELRKRGESHNMADVLAHQRPPATPYSNSERAFSNEFASDPVPFIPDNLKGAVMQAVHEKTGVNVSNKVYCGKLADTRGPLDPEAWVGSADDVRRVARNRNLTVTGAINVQGTIRQTPPVPLAEDIIERHVNMELKATPKADKRELREKVLATHAPKWSD